MFPSENKELRSELQLTTPSTKPTFTKCSQRQLFLSWSQLSTEPLIFKIGQELKKSVLKQYKQTVCRRASRGQTKGRLDWVKDGQGQKEKVWLSCESGDFFCSVFFSLWNPLSEQHALLNIRVFWKKSHEQNAQYYIKLDSTYVQYLLECPGKPNLLTVCLLICQVFWYFQVNRWADR